MRRTDARDGSASSGAEAGRVGLRGRLVAAALLLVAVWGGVRLQRLAGRPGVRIDDPERDSSEHTHRILTSLQLRPDLDVGIQDAATGYFALRIAPAIAPGHVDAADEDLFAVAAQHLNRRRKGIDNVRPTLARSDAKLAFASQSLDRLLMAGGYPFSTCAAGKAQSLFMQMHDALRPGGLVVVFHPVVKGREWHAKQGLPVDCVEPGARELANLAAPWFIAEKLLPGERPADRSSGIEPGFLLVLRRAEQPAL
jgi:hypothetical protein